MDAVLTGQAGTDALRVYARLGAADARFDGRKVAAAVRTAKGRARLLVSPVSTRIRDAVRMVARPRARQPRRRVARSRTGRSARRSGSGRPAGPGEPSQAESVVEGAAAATFRGRQ